MEPSARHHTRSTSITEGATPPRPPGVLPRRILPLQRTGPKRGWQTHECHHLSARSDAGRNRVQNTSVVHHNMQVVDSGQLKSSSFSGSSQLDFNAHFSKDFEHPFCIFASFYNVFDFLHLGLVYRSYILHIPIKNVLCQNITSQIVQDSPFILYA